MADIEEIAEGGWATFATSNQPKPYRARVREPVIEIIVESSDGHPELAKQDFRKALERIARVGR